MICLNCGRPNPSGTSLCNRCRERRPGLERARGGVIYQRTRETARVKKRGSGMLVVGVLLLAGLIFAGGTLAVFMAPKDPAATNPGIAFNPDATPSRLEIFEQVTPTPEPTATPWFPSFTPGSSPTDFGSFFPSPSGETLPPVPTTPGQVTPRPTRPPTPTPTKTPKPTPTSTPTDQPTPDAPVAKFNWSQVGSSKNVKFNNNSTGSGNDYLWEFEGGGQSTQTNPTWEFPEYGVEYDVTLTVTNSSDSDSITKPVTVQAPQPTETPTTAPTPTPTPPPPTPTECVPIPDPCL